MTKQEFIENHMKKSKLISEDWHKNFVALPCNCGDEICKGWAAVLNDPEFIKLHEEDQLTSAKGA